MSEATTTATILFAVADDDFDDVVASERPTLVDVWADWCGPCKAIAPVLDEIAAEHDDRITVAKLNFDENPKTPMGLGVMSIPTGSCSATARATRRAPAPSSSTARPMTGSRPWSE